MAQVACEKNKTDTEGRRSATENSTSGLINIVQSFTVEVGLDIGDNLVREWFSYDLLQRALAVHGGTSGVRRLEACTLQKRFLVRGRFGHIAWM